MPPGQRDNLDRADAAAAALEAYTATNTATYREESIEDRVGDLICDLLHLVRRDGEEGEYIDGKRHNDADPTDLLDRARNNFEEEEEEENGGEEGTEDAEDYAERHPIQLRKEQAGKP